MENNLNESMQVHKKIMSAAGNHIGTVYSYDKPNTLGYTHGASYHPHGGKGGASGVEWTHHNDPVKAEKAIYRQHGLYKAAATKAVQKAEKHRNSIPEEVQLGEDTVSADRKERIIFDQNTGKSRKISSVVSRQNFNNKKYGNRNSPIEFVTGKEPPPDVNADEDKKLKKESMSIISKILEAKTKKKPEEHCEETAVDTELTEQLQEVLAADAMAGDWIHDFVHSDNPKFEGKSKKERIQMALGAYYAKQRNEELEIEANHVAEACKTIAKAASKKKDDVPFDGPYTKTPANVVDKSGAVHTPMSRVRNLARQAMKQQTNEELETQLEGADMLSFTQFVEQLLEYTPGPGGVTRVQGRSYGNQYNDPEGADDAWENEGKAKPAAAQPAVKKGRGRPSGSYGTYKARSAETKAAAAAKSAASKAANKAK